MEVDARSTHQLGYGLGEDVVVPTNGGSGGRRGAEVEVGQCLAVRERPQEQLLREFLLLRRRRRRRGGGKEEEEDRSGAGADPPIWRGPRRREPPFPHGRMPSAMCGHGRLLFLFRQTEVEDGERWETRARETVRPRLGLLGCVGRPLREAQWNANSSGL